ncbi:LuxR family two component transcriptional regulator [Nonomuraea fuscirosea]|uniref:LuxR family two component transcriptional regulator n=1 Tax=Nonomuraea fuscirosea TaxID=1291556 RepID=A0A2T0MXD4_9ACTN|nr:response regulator transcription factor [Nonomuraea fuscirosea]PRX63757.1 LuxR family two component transcriptional regulator [Nonomuraea fuscirosea]
MIRIVLADDQPLVRAGLRALLESTSDMEVVAAAADGEEAVSVVRSSLPDVVLMDIRMPGTDGLEATRRIRADPELAGTRVLILTTFEFDQYVFEALRAGASGFLVKNIEPDHLRQAVRATMRGESLLAPNVTRRLIERFVRPAGDGAEGLSALTDRERDVLALVAEGLSNAEIAERLFLSPATVKTHLHRIMTKLDARDRAQLVIQAYEVGLVRPRWL